MSFVKVATSPVPVILVGAGFWGGEWLKALPGAPAVKLVGFVDQVPALLEAAVAEHALDVVTGSSIADVAEKTGAIAIINATPHDAHLPITLEALALGLHVLGEKPLASNLEQAFHLTRAAENADRLFMVGQSRSYIDHLYAMRSMISSAPASLSQRFLGRAGEGTGFRHTMQSPLLTDMSIHHFDAARLVLGQEALWVHCVESNPPWSWFAGAAVAQATFGMSDGTIYDYEGSWVELGKQTSWNAEWSISLADGSIAWNGEDAATFTTADGEVALSGSSAPGEYLVGAATAFAEALHAGSEPRGTARENIASLAMVHAALESSRTGERVDIPGFIAEAEARFLAAASD
jgi:predicted dehydrogenase